MVMMVIQDCVCVYLVDLVCSRVFANSDGERGFVGHGYSQLHIWHAIVVLGREKERQTAQSVTGRGPQKEAIMYVFILSYLIWFRKELLHDVTFSNYPYRAHCRQETKYAIQ